MEMNYCRRCGTPLEQKGERAYICANGHNLYASAAPTVGIFFITPKNEVILSVRGIEPDKGMLDSFGGFVELSETFEDAAHRELNEELGLDPGDYEELHYLTNAYDDYLYEKEQVPILGAMFWTRLKTDKPLTPADDVADTKTFPLHAVPFDMMPAVDIRTGIRALQALFPDTKQ